MLLLGAASDIWGYILVPAATLVLTGLLVYGTMHPLLKDHRDHEQARKNREMRIDATCDAVLGCDPEPRIGKGKVVGLLEITAENKKLVEGMMSAIGPLNGSGKNVITLLEESTAALREHMEEDDRRFQEVRGMFR